MLQTISVRRRLERRSPLSTLPALLVLLGFVAIPAKAATIMLPEKALWSKGFFKNQVDTMVCAPPAVPSEEGARQVICKGAEENKRFTCDVPERLTLCRTKIVYVTTNTTGTGNMKFTTSRLNNMDLTFFIDSSKTLRLIQDPVIASYLKSDSLSYSYCQRSVLDRKLFYASTGVEFVGCLGLVYFLVAHGLTPDAPTITTGAMWLGGYAGQLYFGFDGKKMFEKAISTFQTSK